MKTIAVPKQEKEQLKKYTEDLKFIADVWEQTADSYRVALRQSMELAWVRTLRFVR
jgi:hypothetical protein